MEIQQQQKEDTIIIERDESSNNSIKSIELNNFINNEHFYYQNLSLTERSDLLRRIWLLLQTKHQQLNQDNCLVSYGMTVCIDGLSINYLSLDNYIYFLCRCIERYPEDKHLSFLSRNIIYLFINKIRSLLSIHTRDDKMRYNAWDSIFVNDILLNIVFKTNPSATWKRLLKELIISDLNNSEAEIFLDGGNSGGSNTSIVNELITTIDRLISSVINCNIEYILSLSISKNIYRYLSPYHFHIHNLNGWTLLHYAASITFQQVDDINKMNGNKTSKGQDKYIFHILINEGSSLVGLDYNNSTPLHTAAASLNYAAILFFCSSGNSDHVKEMVDIDGFRPIEILLKTISICNWKFKISSTNLDHCINLLLSADKSEQIWKYFKSTEKIAKSNHYDSTLMKYNILYYSVIYGDDSIALSAIKLAAKCDKVLWDIPLIKEIILICIKQKREKMIVTLFSEFSLLQSDNNNVLEYEIEQIQKQSYHDIYEIFLNSCLCAAVLTDSIPIATFLFNQYKPLLIFSDRNDDTNSPIYWSFIHFAFIRGNNNMLKLIVSKLDSVFLKKLLFSSINSSSPLITWNYLKISRLYFFNFTKETYENISKISPICILCVLNRIEIIQMTLKSINTDSSASVENESYYKLYFEAIKYSILYGNIDCLKAIRNHIGLESMIDLCGRKEDCNRFALLDLSLRYIKNSLISNELEASLSVKPSARFNLDIVVNEFHKEMEIFRLVLEYTIKFQQRNNMERSMRIDDILTNRNITTSSNNTFKDDTLEYNSLTQLQSIYHESVKRIDAIYSVYKNYTDGFIVLSNNKDMNLQKLHQIVNMLDPLFIRTVSLLQLSYRLWDGVIHNIKNVSYLKTCIRLIVKKISIRKEKAWIRIIFGILLIVDPAVVNFVKDIDFILDKEICQLWDVFIKLLLVSMKSNSNMSAFVSKLLKFSRPNYSFYSGIDDYIFRRLESILSSANINNFKVNNKMDEVYLFFMRYIQATVTDAILHFELGSQLLPMCHTVTKKNETDRDLLVHDYIDLCRALSSKSKYEYILSLYISIKNSSIISESPLYYIFKEDIRSSNNCLVPIFSILLKECSFLNIYNSKSNSNNELKFTGKIDSTSNIDKAISLLIQSYDQLGFDNKDLINYLLPLCSLNLWSSALVLLKQLYSNPISINSVSFTGAIHLFSHSENLSGRSIITAYKKFLYHKLVHGKIDDSQIVTTDFDDISIITPLHFAILANNVPFIETFFSIFVTFPFNIQTLLSFALEIGNTNIIPEIIKIMARYQNNCTCINSNYIESITALKGKHRQLFGVPSKYLSIYKDLSTALESAAHFANIHSMNYDIKNDISYYPLIKITNTLQEDLKYMTSIRNKNSMNDNILLLDGTSTSINDILTFPLDNLIRISISPVFGVGYLSSGHSVLHEIMRTRRITDESKQYYIANLMQNDSWKNMILTVNYRGETPLYNAIALGDYESACGIILKVVHESTSIEKLDIPLTKIQKLYLIETANCFNPMNFHLQKMLCQKAERDYIESNLLCNVSTVTENIDQGVFDYGVRNYNIYSSFDILKVLIKQTEMIWKVISRKNFVRLIQLSHGGNSTINCELDSIIRARQILTLLGIPLSKIGMDSNQSNSKTQAVDSNNDLFQKRMNIFQNLNPKNIKKILPLSTVSQIKTILSGFLKQRSTKKLSCVEETILLYKNINLSMLEIGESCLDLSKSIRSEYGVMKMPYLDILSKTEIADINNENINNRLNTEESKSNFLNRFYNDTYDKLCSQLRFELRFGYTIGGANDELDKRITNQKVETYLNSLQIDYKVLKETFQLSYVILDYARLLMITRSLISLTTIPNVTMINSKIIQDSKSNNHELDDFYDKLSIAKNDLDKINILFKDYSKIDDRDNINGMLNSGILSKIRICEFISLDDLLLFFKFSSNISDRFNKFRTFIIDGFMAICQDRKHFNLLELLHHLSQISTHNNSEVFESTHPSSLKSADKYKEVKTHLRELLDMMQNIRICDLTHQYYDNVNFQYNTQNSGESKPKSAYLYTKRFFNSFSDVIQSLHVSNSSDLNQNNKSSKITISNGEEAIIRDLYNYSNNYDSYKTKYIAEEIRENLNKVYDTANYLYWFIASVNYMANSNVFHSIYNHDVHFFIERTNKYNPLCALCEKFTNELIKPFSLNSYFFNDDRSRSFTSQINNSDHQISVVDKLLSLGLTPCQNDFYQRCPIELAAITGQYKLLEILLINASHTKIRDIKSYNLLIWHVLLQSSVINDNINYEKCLELLLKYGFPIDHPSEASNAGCTCIELAALKRYEAVVIVIGNILLNDKSVIISFPNLKNTLSIIFLSRIFSNEAIYLLFQLYSDSDSNSQMGSSWENFDILFFNFIHFNNAIEPLLDYHCKFILSLYSYYEDVSVDKERDFINIIIDMPMVTITPFIDRKNKNHSNYELLLIYLYDTLLVDISHFRLMKCHNNNCLIQKYLNRCLIKLKSKRDIISNKNKMTVSTTANDNSDTIDFMSVLFYSENTEVIHNLLQISKFSDDALNRIIYYCCLYDISSIVDNIQLEVIHKSVYDNDEDDNNNNNSENSIKLKMEMIFESKNNLFTKTALEVAIISGNINCIDELLKIGINISLSSVVTYILKGKVSDTISCILMKYFIEKNESSSNLLIKAEGFESIDIFLNSLQFKSGNQIIYDNETILHITCRRGFLQLSSYLLSLGASPLINNNDRKTPLDCSIGSGHSSITKLMYNKTNNRYQKAINTLAFAFRKYLIRKLKYK